MPYWWVRLEKNGKKRYIKIETFAITVKNWNPKSFVGFGDLIDEVVGIGINKRFGAPFGDGGTLLHEWSKNSKLTFLLKKKNWETLKLIFQKYSDVTLGVEMLLEAGADPKIKDSNKKTALDHAVAKGKIR